MNHTKTVTVITVVIVVALLLGLGYFTYYMLYRDRTPTVLPNPVTTEPTPAAPVTPMVKVLTPNGGESLCIGDTYGVRWEAPGIARVRVGLASGGKTFGEGIEVPASSGYYAWTVPDVSGWLASGVTSFSVFITAPNPATTTAAAVELVDSSDRSFIIKRCPQGTEVDKG